jgi:hypothetical protein
MPVSLPTICTALAIVALGAAAVQLARTVSEMQRRIDDLEAPPVRKGGDRRPSGRAMFSALYPERGTDAVDVGGLPGSSWLGVAALLVVGAVASSLLVPAAPPPPPAVPDSVVTALEGRLDSLVSTVAVLRDSLRAVPSVAAPASVHAGQVASGTGRRSTSSASAMIPAAPPAAGIIPPAPRPPTP